MKDIFIVLKQMDLIITSQLCLLRDITHINLEAFRKAIKDVYFVAKPLPARTLTTVRIPYKMGGDLSCEEWEDVCQIILEELVEKDIPVEIWQK